MVLVGVERVFAIDECTQEGEYKSEIIQTFLCSGHRINHVLIIKSYWNKNIHTDAVIENKLIQRESEEEEVVVVVASAVVGVGVSVSVSQPTLKAPGHRPSSGPQEMAKVTRSTMMISPSSHSIS